MVYLGFHLFYWDFSVCFILEATQKCTCGPFTAAQLRHGTSFACGKSCRFLSKSWYKASALWYFTKGGTCGRTWWPQVWEGLLGLAEWMPSSHPHLTVTGCNALHVGCCVWHPFTSIVGGQWRRKENINFEDMWQIWTGEPKTLDTWKSVHTTLASPSSVTTSVMDGICTTHLFLVCGLLPHACGRGRRLLPWGSSEHCR